jgi:hypothetical protein
MCLPGFLVLHAMRCTSNFTMQIMQCERVNTIAALIFNASKYFLVVIVLNAWLAGHHDAGFARAVVLHMNDICGNVVNDVGCWSVACCHGRRRALGMFSA